MARRRSGLAAWSRLFERSAKAMTKRAVRSGTRAVGKAVDQAVKQAMSETVRQTLKPAAARRALALGAGDWIPGVAMGATGARRFHLYRPPGVAFGERLPLMVMLHGCGQDAASFAASTRMNRLAARERFFVLYPEQDRLAHPQGCWHWFDTAAGRAQAEAALILKAIDQVTLLYPVDRDRVAVAGLSAGAGMAALLATRHPQRFRAVVMHSGVPPGLAHSTATALGAMQGRRHSARLDGLAAGPWPPLLAIHGSADGVVAPRNGEAAARLWAEAASALPGTPRRVQRGQRYPMTTTDFKRLRRTAATLIEIEGLGHAWSGGTAQARHSDPRGPDASRLAWAFAAKQFAAPSAEGPIA